MQSVISCESIVDWARSQEDKPKFHAALMDAPYEIGFMSKGWDNSGVAFQVDTWRAVHDVLLPGAFMFVFGGSRTVHRMAVAIEDAGFVLHPMLVWIFGSGFPKATRIDTQIDRNAPRRHLFADFANHVAMQRKHKALTQKEIAIHFPSKTGGITGCVWNWENGANVPTLEQWQILQPLLDLSVEFLPLIEREEAEREILATRHDAGKRQVAILGTEAQDYDITAPATPLAQQWEDHRYGKQAIKPAAEFIICAQRPYEGRPIDSITASGAGALNIEAGRIGTDGGGWGGNPSSGYSGGLDTGGEAYSAGRWPANVVLTHAPYCTPSHCSEGCAVAAVGRQSGEREVSGSARLGKSHEGYVKDAGFLAGLQRNDRLSPNDTGTAARYFHNSDYALETAERIAAADPMMYTAKADKWQREAGLAGWQPTTVNDGRQTPIDNAYQRGETPRRNTHPTVKPLSLCHWLASLLLPPDTYVPRRLLVPFSGSGSEMIGALLAGWEHVQGVEIEQEYIDIAEHRIAFWQQYAGMDYDAARQYAKYKQEQLECEARVAAPLDDLPLFKFAP